MNEAVGEPVHVTEPIPKTVPVHFIKSAFFRVIHADGAWGGVTPNGHIQMALYSERAPIPTKLEHPVTESGQINTAEILNRGGKSGVLREVEVDVIMTLEVAKALRDWLDSRINVLTTFKKTQK